MLLAMLALTVIYRVARPQEDSMRNVLPGAMVATLLWWLVDVLFGVTFAASRMASCMAVLQP